MNNPVIHHHFRRVAAGFTIISAYIPIYLLIAFGLKQRYTAMSIDITKLILISLGLTLIGLTITIWLLINRVFSTKQLPQQQPSAQAPWRTFAYLIVMFGALILLSFLWPDHNINTWNLMLLKNQQSLNIWFYIFISVIISPTIEELIFRRFWLSIQTKYQYALTSSSMICFTLFHVPSTWVSLIEYTLIAAILTLIYEHTGRIRYSIIGHMGNNLIAIMPLVLKILL